nr:MAG: Protein of unknown function (DUF1642) [Bacteriophage sp.]
MDRNEAISREEAVWTISRISGGSVSYAEDLYDSFFPKPVVSQCVADWYEEHKNDLNDDIWAYLTSWADTKWDEFKYWMYHTGRNKAITTLVNMHQFGYEVEKEPRYTVRIKGLSEINRYLNKECDKEFLFADSGESEDYQTKFTRKELEEGGFGEVFDNPMFEVKEVTDE